jgi:hypothetical protein
MTNLEWIKGGNSGCTFATLFAKNPECVGWHTYTHEEWALKQLLELFGENELIVSIIFPESWTKEYVRFWALSNNFFEENTSDDTKGLRIMCPQGVSWVQYFGKDSHVKTRQAPSPMLLYTRKLNKSYYVKVGFKGILHLAHAWCTDVKESVYDLLWNQSYKQTSKLLGHKPTIREAAKTTWHDSDIKI